MPEFKLSCYVTVNAYTIVEADSLEEATAIAAKRGVELGGPGMGTYPDETWVVEEADGAPSDITYDEDDQ